MTVTAVCPAGAGFAAGEWVDQGNAQADVHRRNKPRSSLRDTAQGAIDRSRQGQRQLIVDDRTTLRDYQSLNGTFLNADMNSPVSEVALADGDTIFLATTAATSFAWLSSDPLGQPAGLPPQ